MRKPYLDKCSNTLSRYELKYGKKLGKIKYTTGINKRSNTMINKYGTKVISCCVSKESLKFFIKLYKKIRKFGVLKNDVVWGIAGNKEFILNNHIKNKIYFYDFVIKSKKIIIEYNNTFWHPREKSEWRGFINYEKKYKHEIDKKKYAISSGYSIYYVWNDDNLIEKINYLTGIIIND